MRKRGVAGFMSGRKAQITVFIIIGIIIIFSVGIYSYLRSTGVRPADIFQPKSPPVIAFIEACLESTAEDAIRAMGDQGGYIVVPQMIAVNPTRHVSLVPGVGGEFAPKVPYWYYEGQTQIPGIGYMEHETRQYINDNLRYCLNNYEGLTDEYTITELSNYSADVVFADKESIIGLDYSVEIRPRGSEEITKRDQFTVRLDVKVKRMWEMGKELLEAENQNTFFENMTLNLMASHPSDKVPFTGMTFHCGRLQWPLFQVKQTVIDALEPAVGAIRFRNTNLPMEWEGDDDDYAAVHRAVSEWKESEVVRPLVLPDYIPSDSYDYFQYYMTFTDEDYADLSVMSSFNDAWGMKFLATPNEYGVMKSSTQDLKSEIISSLFCLNRYHFVYDVVYPVMISISDPNAFHKTGYVFRYAFPVQIYHNTPSRSLLPTTIIEPTEYGIDFCDFYSNEEHTIIARDVVTNAELSKVNLTFQCLRERCNLGSTRTNNRHLQWAGPFPDGCSGAMIVANRSGYLQAERQFDGSEPFFIDMYPTQKVVFDVRRHAENAPDSAKFLEPDMTAILNLELRDPPLNIFEIFTDDNRFNRTQEFEILRSDATYFVNLMLIKPNNEGEDILVGGWVGNWTVKLEDVLDAGKVVFHIPQKYPSPRTMDDAVAVYELMSNRSLFPGVEPELVRADEMGGDDEEAGEEAPADDPEVVA